MQVADDRNIKDQAFEESNSNAHIIPNTDDIEAQTEEKVILDAGTNANLIQD